MINHPDVYELVGKSFGKWVVVSVGRKRHHVVCLCSCGQEREVLKYNLLKGYSSQCLRCQMTAKATTHGLSRLHKAEYSTWKKAKARCYGKSSKDYPDYGGRGIRMCTRWLHNFECFLRDMGPRPSPNHSIDRVNNNGDYEPSNCRWASPHEQARNKRSNVKLEYRGETKTIGEWAEKTGVPYDKIYYWAKKGVPLKDILLRVD